MFDHVCFFLLICVCIHAAYFCFVKCADFIPTYGVFRESASFRLCLAFVSVPHKGIGGFEGLYFEFNHKLALKR